MSMIGWKLNGTMDDKIHDPLHGLAVKVNGPQSSLQVLASPVSHILLPQQFDSIVLMH